MLLFIGAMGKSAQFFLHTWLPDAMEGPTPVSALIHAATMVTAGVFLVCRMSPLFEYAPEAKQCWWYMSALSTAFFAATVGLVQNDIKRVIAYSTCSQLGYMFVAAGVGVYSVAMFHLLTHAFFKAMLFSGRRLGHHRDAPRAGYAQLWRAAEKNPADILGDADRHAGDYRRRYSADHNRLSPASCPRTRLSRAPMLAPKAGFAFWALVIAALFTSFLFLAADVHDLLGQAARRYARA